MTAPRFTACRCSHSHDDHAQEGFAPQCTAAGCTCLRYRPVVAAVPETTAAGARTPLPSAAPAAVPPMPEPGPDKPPARLTLNELMRRGRDSELKPINRLTERIDAMLEDLRERVLAEIAAADLKSAIVELEAQLAAKRGQLQTVGKGKRTPPAAKTGGSHACPDCPDTFGTAQGLGAHRAHKHGYRTAKAG